MKKLIALILSLCMLLSVVGITAAADAGFTLTLEGEGAPAPLTGAVTYTLPTPVAPEGKVFAGWQGMHNEQNVFLPAGAEITLTADATLTAVYVGMRMRSLPEIRYGIEGLRFLTDVSKADLNALQFLTTVGFGTLIAPQDHLKAGQFLTHATLNAAEKDFLDVETAGAYAETDETFTLAGSIGHVKTQNFCRVFLGAGYLSLTYTDGSTGYVYAPVKQSDTQPYLYRLASTAFEARSAQERVFLTQVFDAVVDLTLTCDANNHITAFACGPLQATSYEPAYGVKYEKNNERIVVTVKEGRSLDYNTDYAAIILDGLVYDVAFDRNFKDVSIASNGRSIYIAWLGEYSGFY